MKIAIASEGAEPGSLVSQHAARAPYYLLFDERGSLQEVVDNPCATTGGPAGINAAHYLQQLDINIVVAAQFGEKFIAELESAGIKHVQQSGMVKEAVMDLIA